MLSGCIGTVWLLLLGKPVTAVIEVCIEGSPLCILLLELGCEIIEILKRTPCHAKLVANCNKLKVRRVTTTGVPYGLRPKYYVSCSVSLSRKVNGEDNAFRFKFIGREIA